MSADREDSNWDTAQRSHRDIQEEILHSRNLELFEDVERLLPGTKLPACLEQEMPVDPWDPEVQKLKRKLPAASRETGTSPRRKKARGHEIPEGGHEGFRSVAELLREAGKLPGDKAGKGKRKSTTKTSDPPNVVSEDEEEEDVEEDHDLLYGPVQSRLASQGKRPAAKVKNAGPKGAATGWKANVSTGSANSIKPRSQTQRDSSLERLEAEEQDRKAKRDELNRSAQDFFSASRSSRQREPTPPLATPPSSPLPPRKKIAIRLEAPPFPESDEIPLRVARSAKQAVPDTGKLSPGLAAAAGFSQIDAIDLSWDDEEGEDDDGPVPTPAPDPRSSAPIPRSLASRMTQVSSRQSETLVAHPRQRIMGISRSKATQTKSIDIMPPPPVPLSSPIAPTGPDATQAIRRPGARRRGPILPSSESSPGGESPFVPPNHVRRPPADLSSPLQPMAGRNGSSSPVRRPNRRRPKAPAQQVKGYVSTK